MKKILFFAIICLALVGCDNTTIVDGARLKTIRVAVKAADWRYTQQGTADQFNNNYFYAGVDVSEITEYVFDYGEVKAYVVYDRMNMQYARKYLLPYVLHVEEPSADNGWLFYTQTIDFTYGIGWAEFNFRMSDFAYEEDMNINPSAMEFDIVITYPQESNF